MNSKILKKTAQKAFLLLVLCAFKVHSQDAVQEENPQADVPKQKQVLTVTAPVHSYNLNPHTASYNSEAQILSGLFEGLFSYDPVTLEPQYAIAVSYKISRDSKRWTFTLREDAFFSDGTPVTAESVKKSWIQLLRTQGAPYASLFDIIKGASDFRTGNGSEENVAIYDLDEHTLSIHLTTPASHLPRLLCMASFAVTGTEENVFSGPFVLSEINENQAVLEKNEHYYDKENTKLDRITFRFCDDADENAFAFNTGLSDWVSGAVNLSRTISKDAVHVTAEFATEYMFFKMRKNVWSNAEFRQALLEAAPWDSLRENTFVQASTLVYPIGNYPSVRGYSYTDGEEASSLMKIARRNAGIPDGEILEIVMAVTESEYMQKKAALLKEAWEKLGVSLRTVEIPSDKYLYSIPDVDADIFSYTWIGDFADPLAFLELFRGNSTLNVTNWSNPDFDALLNEAALYTNEKHNSLLGQAEQLLLDEAVILPVQHPVSLNVIDLNAVGGWAPNSFDIHPLKYLFKKETKPDVPNVVMLR